MMYGICMEGNEPAFERALFDAHQTFIGVPTLHLFEVGTAAAATALAMTQYMAQHRPNFLVHTVDIPGGWSYGSEAVRTACASEFRLIASVHPAGAQGTLAGPDWTHPIHFAFIDGCHGAACAAADFEAVARHTVPGSVVVFHDTSESCQGVHLQPHCQTGIQVRRALHSLGLLTGQYPDWELVEETHTPHGIAVFRRIIYA